MAIPPSPRVSFTCLTCGKDATRFLHQISKISGRYCSPACWYATRDKQHRRTCKQCGERFTNRNALKFCGKECFDLFKKRRRTRSCKICSKNFEVRVPALPNKYCSKQCSEVGLRKPPVVNKCKGCGVQFTFRSMGNRSKVYCTEECKRKNNVGPKNALWRGSNFHHRGKTWKPLAAAARVADNHQCVCCQKSEATTMPVDHIIPYRIAINYWAQADPNSLINLACLCRSCHSRKTHAERCLLMGDVMGFIAAVKPIIPLDRVMAALRFWKMVESGPVQNKLLL